MHLPFIIVLLIIAASGIKLFLITQPTINPGPSPAVTIALTQSATTPAALITKPLSPTKKSLPTVTPASPFKPSDRPTPSPTKGPVVSTEIILSPPPGSTTPSATGQITVQITRIDSHYSNDPDYRILTLRFNGLLTNLQPEKEYYLAVCSTNGACVGGQYFRMDD